MKKLLGVFSKKRTDNASEAPQITYGGVGLVFAPGPDRGLYVKGIVRDGPAWQENCNYNRLFHGQQDAHDGNDGAIRIGDCLLDVQEVFDKLNKKARGKKYDVFARSEDHVASLLRGMRSPLVELSFRRVIPSGDSTLIAVILERRPQEIDSSKEAQRAVDEVRQRRVTERMTEVDMRFAEIDEDGSGSVSLEELLRFLQERISTYASRSCGRQPYDSSPVTVGAPTCASAAASRCRPLRSSHGPAPREVAPQRASS